VGETFGSPSFLTQSAPAAMVGGFMYNCTCPANIVPVNCAASFLDDLVIVRLKRALNDWRPSADLWVSKDLLAVPSIKLISKEGVKPWRASHMCILNLRRDNNSLCTTVDG
jgi:hypothetical protein